MRISDWSSDVCSSDLAFDAGNLVECHVEAVAAELAMLNFLKLFAQLVIGLWPDRLLEFGEDHGVLARSMRLIHARECSHRSGKPFTVAAGAAAVPGAVEEIRSEERRGGKGGGRTWR